MKTLPLFALLIPALLVGCGKIQTKNSERKKPTTQEVKQNPNNKETLSPEQMAKECSQRPGILVNNGTICIFESYRNAFAKGEPVSNKDTMDYHLTEIAPGTAIYVTGHAYPANSLEIIVNNAVVASLPTTNPISTNGGRLGYRLRPGNMDGVNLYVYSCVDQTLSPTRCPY